MDLFAFSLATISGMCFATAVFHLFISQRRHGADMKHFAFGLFAVAYAGALLTGLLMHGATRLPDIW
jgi:hypothetical protein